MPSRRRPSEPSRPEPRKRTVKSRATGARGAAEPARGAAEPPDEAAAPSPLAAYRKKRDPDRTTEPFGAPVPAPAPVAKVAAPLLRFIVQEHWARNLHFDLRLELDGVLKSWAVPKGPSVRAEEKRLAVHVEDHPMEYANFEGTIPSGNYGAGSVIVWDRGTYRTFKPESIREQYERGLMELELLGHKLGGKWTLVRTRSEKEWLLLKKKDAAAADVDALERWPRSVICGLTVQEMKDAAAWLAALRSDVAATGAPRVDLRAAQVKHMLATTSDQPFTRAGWVFEIKYDGVRVVAERRGDEVRMLGRSGEDITARYPEIAEALGALTVTQFVIDGEIIAFDDLGRPSFQRLQKRMLLKKPRDIAATMARVPVRAVFFDCLALEGHDLRKLGLLDRKALLARALPPAGVVQSGDHIEQHGEAFFDAANEMGLEGIVGKRADSAYVGRRSPDWVKLKCQRRQEFVIGGWTDPKGAGRHFGALHVGVHEDDKLVHVTRVGSGFDDAFQDKLWPKLLQLARKDSPFGGTGPNTRADHWVEPQLVCEVRFTEWTSDGGLRHPIFLGLRDDRKPEEVVREGGRGAESEAAAAEPDDTVEDAAPPEDELAAARAAAARPPATAAAGAAREVRLSNLRKVFWPDEGYTKGDLIAYYESIAPLMLHYLRDRPIVLTRYPDGIKGKSFFQKDAPVFVPDWIRTESVYSKDSDRDIKFFVLDDADSLRYVANMGTIPIHMWSARSGSLERPDWFVIDFDPKGAPFAHVVECAVAMREILEELEIPGYPKTSGATGLHVLVPLGRRYTHDEAKTFARLLATMVQQEKPEISTLARPLHARGGKVYVDWGQNGHGVTIVAPYSLRPVPGASASCPLRWNEVNKKLDPANYTLKTLPKRFEKMDDPLAPVLGAGIDMGTAIAAIEERMRRKGST